MVIRGHAGDFWEGEKLCKKPTTAGVSCPCATLGQHREGEAAGFSDGWENGPLTFLNAKEPLLSCGVWEVEGTRQGWWPRGIQPFSLPLSCAPAET